MSLSVVAATAQLAGLTALYANGRLRIYSGSPPATPETAITIQQLLVEFTFTAFAAAVFAGGVVSQTASFVAVKRTPTANGTAGFARALKSDLTTVLGDFSVGTQFTDVVIPNLSIVTTVDVEVQAYTLAVPAL